MESIGFRFRRRSEKDFQDGCHGVHLGFPTDTILAIFDRQVTLMLHSKFGINWPFGSGEEAKNSFIKMAAMEGLKYRGPTSAESAHKHGKGSYKMCVKDYLYQFSIEYRWFTASVYFTTTLQAFIC